MDEGISVESNQDHVIVVLSILKILINVKEIYVISFLEENRWPPPQPLLKKSILYILETSKNYYTKLYCHI